MNLGPLPRSPPPSNTDEIAADWLSRRLRAPLKQQEQAALNAWLAADAAHAEAFARAEGAYERVGDMASAPQIMAMRSAALALERKPFAIRTWGLAAAACLVLGLFGWIQLAGPLPRVEPTDRHSNAAVQTPRERYVTDIGERLSATLSDGSVLMLNTDSEVRVRYSDEARRIELVRGQGYFTVAHNPSRPFLVEAGGQSVRALGTEFEVRLHGDQVEVVLVEGRVAIGTPEELARGDLRRALELQAGERAVAELNTPAAYEVTPVDTNVITSWRSGRILFSSTSLREAVGEINRYRTQPLVVEDARVAAMEISGAFRTADAQSFGQALGQSLPVEERTSPNGRALLVLREGAGP